MKRLRFYGQAVSPGIALGKACVFGEISTIPRRKIKVGHVGRELTRLSRTIDISRTQLQELKEKAEKEMGKKEADIFDAHLLFLDDPVFLAQIQKKLVENQINLEAAIEDVIKESIKMFTSVKDPYFRERIQDIRDVGRRLLENLLGYNRQCFLEVEEDIIIAAEELTPSDTINLDQRKIKGFVTEKGGATSHAAILARSLGIPLVSGVPRLTQKLELGAILIVDGFTGEVIKNPYEKEIQAYTTRIESLKFRADEEKRLAQLPSVTQDGYKIKLLANIRSEEDVHYALRFRAEGIGLYRTEIHFIDTNHFPTEEEQFVPYRQVVEMMNPHPVTIRTLDLGGDKFSTFYPDLKEGNPYLGLRAIRISLDRPELFKTQLRAILRASAYGKVKILLPMISCLEEVLKAKVILKKAINELEREGQAFDPHIQIGVMIEVPSAAIVVDAILKEVNFISVGTNDLIQYTLAVDRSNERVSRLYEPLNPAILHLLKNLAEAAKRANKEISICGEMAGDTRYTGLLLGLGYEELSMSSFFIPQVKRVVRALSMEKARQINKEVMNLDKVAKIKQYLEHLVY